MTRTIQPIVDLPVPRGTVKIAAAAALISLSCSSNSHAISFSIDGSAGSRLTASVTATFDNPWAMSFISPREMLVTTKPGKLWLVTDNGSKTAVKGVPKVFVGGQGGLGDVVPHPDFKQNGLIYLSYVEKGNSKGTRGAVVVRARLELSGQPKLVKMKRIWTQSPKKSRRGHFSHRLAFGPKGSVHQGKLFITSGDRQAKEPAQRWDMALGKIIRLNDDGTIPQDNPFQDKGKLAKSFWTLGHRNMLGISFDASGNLWVSEMGPAHGDELNLIVPGQNYGWPVVSNGDNYDGSNIPDHKTRPEFTAPRAYWVPSIAPSGLVIDTGARFPQWKGHAWLGGLVSKALIRVKLSGTKAAEVERFSWDKRVREVEQGPDGALWVLEDRKQGRLLRLDR